MIRRQAPLSSHLGDENDDLEDENDDLEDENDHLEDENDEKGTGKG